MPSREDPKQSGGKSPDRPERSDWRRGGNRSGAGSDTPANEREWTQHEGYAAEKLLWVFRAKVAAGALLAVALFGVLIWSLVRPTRTPFVSTTLVEYKYPLPPNAWAGEDVAAIRDLLAKEGAGATGDEPLSVNGRPPIDYLSVSKKDWFGAIQEQLEEATDDSWKAKLKRLDRGPGDGAVILYVSGHGVVDADGRPCLLLPRRSADEKLMSRENWLTIGEFFDTLFYDREKESQRLPTAVLKLVVFDTNRIDTAWHVGMVHNDFAGKLKKVVEQLPVDNLFVLNSTSRGQIGWAAPELGGSVFSFFFRRGMQGHADQGAFGDDNDQVSIRELTDYVQAKVPQWVDNYRSDQQRPMLIRSRNTDESDEQTDLAYYGPQMLELDDPTAKTATAARTKQIETMRTRWAKIRERFWDRHDRLASVGIRFHPLRWQEFQSKLLRLEQLVAAGPLTLDDKKFEQRMFELDDLAALLAKRPAQGETPNSVALIQAGQQVSSNAVKQLADKLAAGESLDMTNEYSTRAMAAWQWLKENPTPATIDAAVAKAIPLAEITRRPDKELVEIHFLRLLRRGLDSRLWASDSKMIRDVVSLRGQAELAASPADERFHYWLQPGVQEGDRIRRLAQDNLLVGRKSELQLAAEDVKNASGHYASAQSLAKILAAAYSLQDRAWAEIPAMIAYHARRLPENVAPQPSDDAITALIALRREIESQLVNFEKLVQADDSFPANEITGLRDRVNSLAARLQAERDKLTRVMKEFVAGASDDDRRRIEDTLATAILAGELRGRLYTTYLGLLSDYTFVDAATSLSPVPNDAVPNDAVPNDAVAPRRLKRIVGWQEHPALALLGLSAMDFDIPLPADARMRKTNELIHNELARLSDAVDNNSQMMADLDFHTTPGAPPTRQKVQQAARSLRQATGLLRLDSLPSVTPCERLAMFDRQRMLLWHCQRTTDDWLGPAQIGERHKPFFLTVANHYLAMAKNAAGGKHAARLEAKIKGREQASQYKGSDSSVGALFVADDRELLIRPDDETKPHQVSITLSRASGIHLPRGKAAYYLAGPQGLQVDTRESNIDPPADIGRIDYTIDPRPESLGRLTNRKYSILNIQSQMHRHRLQGFLAYRGHQFTSPAMVLRLTPYGCTREMEYILPKYESPAILIKGPRQRLAVMIVLDCSGSMSTKIDGVTRLQLAKQVIRDILGDIQGVRDVEVGLRLYGHRARYVNITKNATDVKPSAYAKQHGGSHLLIRPPADVEKVTGLTTPANVLKRFPVELQLLKDHGYTPLYLAMYQTITEDFKEVDAANIRRQIIVITDGVNVQYTKDEDPAARVRVADATAEQPAVLVTDQDVKNAIQQDRNNFDDPLHISVIGIGVGNKKKATDWTIGSKRELQDLLGKGNEFIEVDNDRVDQLKAKLRRSMGLYQYEVVNRENDKPVKIRVDGRPVQRMAELGEIVTFHGRSENLRIRFASGTPVDPFDITALGRESFKLRIGPFASALGGNRKTAKLEHHGDVDSEEPFRHAERKAPEIRGPQGLLRIRPHKPAWQGNAVKFFVAMQYQDRNHQIFTPRPREVFATVRPFVDERRNRFEAEYAMFDIHFDSKRSLPLMSFVAPNWPQDVDEAEIAIWVKFDKLTPPDATIEVGQPNPVMRMEIGESIVRFEVKPIQQSNNTYIIQVTEKHTNDTSYDTVRVQIEPDRQPDRIRRCYFTEAKTVEHHFIYENDSSLTLGTLDRYNVHLTKVESLKKGAIRFPAKKPILVRVDPKP